MPTTANPLTACRDAIVAVWNANWSGSEPVIWQQNSTTVQTPDINQPVWLHLEIDPASERIAAYGGGPRNNEKLIRGVVVVRAFGLCGIGDDPLYGLQDRALSVLRSRSTSRLTFFGESSFSLPSDDEEALWTHRTAMVGFEFRFTG